MVKMAWERGGTRARWENGEGHMGKVGLPPFFRSGPIFCGARISVRHRKLHFCGARAKCATESLLSVAHSNACATESLLSVAHRG